MIRHIFLDPDEIVEFLNTLRVRCPGIVGWEIGQHQGEPNENGDPWHGAEFEVS